MTTNMGTTCRGRDYVGSEIPLSPTGYCAECVDKMCAEGDGLAAGLPPIPEDKLDDVIAAAARAMTHPWNCQCLVCLYANEKCSECGLYVWDIDAEDNHHVIVSHPDPMINGIILIECEGYHTPALRAAGL